MSRYLTLTMTMKYKTQNAAVSLVNTAKYLEPETGYVIPATELKRMEVLADYWKDVKNSTPCSGRTLRTGLPVGASPEGEVGELPGVEKGVQQGLRPAAAGKPLPGDPAFRGEEIYGAVRRGP